MANGAMQRVHSPLIFSALMDGPPFLNLGLLEGRKRFRRRLLFAREDVLLQFSEPLSHRPPHLRLEFPALTAGASRRHASAFAVEILPMLGKSSAAIEPSDGSLDDPNRLGTMVQGYQSRTISTKISFRTI
jgi:hypothetical protein